MRSDRDDAAVPDADFGETGALSTKPSAANRNVERLAHDLDRRLEYRRRRLDYILLSFRWNSAAATRRLNLTAATLRSYGLDERSAEP